ncbi:Arc family DNA-binding protein [Paracandidimonas soli]|uniref:Arc-like DNA binding dprotein n=1 Tax=Paracandidimonas soli TaxID=1917182 RepID=A0A4R3UNP9_9BURK|nr:Arc family DNA-binding protein [Paracandidimonas soli]TCU91634.1 Arc-like DNA binding dprotein [Paracandidimonas soli]
MSKQIMAYPVRLDPALREQLQVKADQNDRSLHREIVFRLKESLAKENAPEGESSEALVQ